MAIHNNMSKQIKYIISTSLIILMIGCYYDKKDQIYPASATTTTCDTSNITYSTTIKALINTNCNACHSTAACAANGGGIALDNYTVLYNYVSSGKFYNSIAQNGLASAMPKNLAKLDQCTINKFAIWINKGALNN